MLPATELRMGDDDAGRWTVHFYLARKAQGIDATALVVWRKHPQTGEEWVLRREGKDDIGLGDSFGAAKEGLRVWMHAQRAAKR